MIGRLTQPTTARLTLWVVLSVVWFLFIVQAMFMQSVKDTYVPGAVFWALVQGWLLWMAVATYRRRRAIARGNRSPDHETGREQ